ncbi:MAG: transposase [Candidatus Omnitrophica bacterium]|nr:transposase [Candidatus Omnitrophota bacterium]
MPRIGRIVPLDATLHVISRGNNRRVVFHSESDKLRYYALLFKLKQENKIDILHYCLMANHVHLVLQLKPESTLAKFMKQLNLTYSHYYRKLYEYAGYLWQGRFKSNIIEMDSYLLQCGKYIELNPVRAGIIAHPAQYLFSSYNFYAEGKSDSLVTPSPVYLGLAGSPARRQEQYIDFVIDSSIINSDLLASKIYIGSQAFINRLQTQYKIGNYREKRGRPFKAEQ